MNCYLRIDCISPDVLDFIKETTDIQGAILGDYTCNRRMFAGGYAGLIKNAGDFKLINKEIILQTPLYMTSRKFEEIIDGISFLHQEYGVKKFLVQDVGVLSMILKIIPDAECIWSQMGRNRGNVLNMDSVMFLKDQGLTGMELCSGSRISMLNACGMKAYALYGSIRYMTISRNCYNKCFHDRAICRIDCCNHSEVLTTETGKTITVDGFFLGKNYFYDDSPAYWRSVVDHCENLIIQCENLEETIYYYETYKETMKIYEQDFCSNSSIK